MEGELYSPIAELEISAVVELQGSIPQYMNARKLQRFVWRAVDPEGTYHFMKMKWWTRCFIWTSLLALLSSLTLGIASSVELNSHAVYHVAKGLLILTSLIAAFSMGALVQKVGSYGVVRLLRLFWLRSLRKHRTEVSSGGTVSHTVTKKRK
jgi:hypothetical protein